MTAWEAALPYSQQLGQKTQEVDVSRFVSSPSSSSIEHSLFNSDVVLGNVAIYELLQCEVCYSVDHSHEY